jgi:CopG family nickel-responsive transcriptional regulator
MQRVTVTLDDDLMAELDRVIAARGYQNRSEAIRDLTRAGLKQSSLETGGIENSIAVLSFVYEHEARELARRLTTTFHHHHDLTVSSLHVHLDDRNCLEVGILKGPTSKVQHFAEHVISERAVKYGNLHIMPAGTPDPEEAKEQHPHSHAAHG